MMLGNSRSAVMATGGNRPGDKRRLGWESRRRRKGGWPRIIFISLAQRRTGALWDWGVGSEKGATNERQCRWRAELRSGLSLPGCWRALVGRAPLPCPFRASAPPVDPASQLPSAAAQAARREHSNRQPRQPPMGPARHGTPPAYRNETRMPVKECVRRVPCPC